MAEIRDQLVKRKGFGPVRFGEVAMPAKVRCEPPRTSRHFGQSVDEVVSMARETVQQDDGSTGAFHFGA